jgi:SAM-dependent methyltransferase
MDCTLVQAEVTGDVENIYREDGYFSEESTGTTFGVDRLEKRANYDSIPLNERTFDIFNVFGENTISNDFMKKSVLEIGPSPNGGTIRYLTGLSDVDGLEISEYATNFLRDLGFNMYCGSVNDARLEKKYDIILAYEVVEHLKDPKSSFFNIYTLLNPGGVFVFSTGNANSVRARLQGKRWSYFLPPQHLFYFADKTAIRYLEGAGFKRGDIKVNKYSLWSKRQAIKLGFPGFSSRLFLRLVSNLTSGMTVYAVK